MEAVVHLPYWYRRGKQHIQVEKTDVRKIQQLMKISDGEHQEEMQKTEKQ